MSEGISAAHGPVLDVAKGAYKGKRTEKHAAGFHEREEYDETEAFFRLLIECFGDRAGGYDCPGRQSRKREIPVSDSRKRD